jgi:hypothetical protein
MGRAGHVACMGRIGMHAGFWWELQMENPVDCKSIIVKWILEIWDGVEWAALIWLRIGTCGVFL